MFESLGVAKIGIVGLGTVGVFGVIMLLLQKFVLKSGKQKDIEVAKHKGKQEQIQDQIGEITKEQEVLDKQIKMSEQASEESQEKVKIIAQKAAVQMNTILKEDSIAKIDSVIDDGWEDL